MQIFNITKISKSRVFVRTQYNEYTIIIDEVKGIGIYLADTILIKQYYHKNLSTALNYLMKKEIFI